MLQARAQLGHIKVIGLAAILGLSLSTGSAVACSVSAWTGSGTATDTNANGTKRYKGECALEASNGVFVEEGTASFSSESEVKTIFYVNADDATASGDVVIMSLTGAGGSSVDVVLNGGNVTLTSGSNSPSPSVTLNSGWNSISVDWSASGDSTMTVANRSGSNSATLTGANSGTVSGVRLGAVSGSVNGPLYFDAFVANRDTMPTRETNCDADGSGGDPSTDDAISILRDVLGLGTATGTPDCDENGSISADDAILALRCVLGLDTCNG